VNVFNPKDCRSCRPLLRGEGNWTPLICEITEYKIAITPECVWEGGEGKKMDRHLRDCNFVKYSVCVMRSCQLSNS